MFRTSISTNFYVKNKQTNYKRLPARKLLKRNLQMFANVSYANKQLAAGTDLEFFTDGAQNDNTSQ